MAFEISGKGDIDIAVYASSKNWERIFKSLVMVYGEPRVIGKRFAAFYSYKENFEIEISLMKGLEVKVDRAVTDFLLDHSEWTKQYEELKRKYCFSKREYQIQKDKFIRKILNSIR